MSIKAAIKIVMIAFCVITVISGCSNSLSDEYVQISQYKGISAEKIQTQEITADNVEAEIQKLLRVNADTISVTNRPSQNGDAINIDFEGRLNGEVIASESAKGYRMTIGTKTFTEEFMQGLIDRHPGDVFDIEVTLPDDYIDPDLAGTKMVYHVKMNALYETVTPTLNDEFVKNVSTHAQTVEAFRQEIADALEKAAESEAKKQFENQVWASVMDNTNILLYPEERLEGIQNSLIQQYEIMALNNNMDFDDYAHSQTGLTREAFDDMITEAAKASLKQELAANLIAKKHNLLPSDREYEEALQEYVRAYGFVNIDSLKSLATDEELYAMITQDRVKSWLATQAKS